jgi:hypothetical protein
LTPPINDAPRKAPEVIIVEKKGCWPFRRVRKHKSTPLNDLARRTLTPHPSYNDPVIVQISDGVKRSPGSEDIATLAMQLEQGTFFQQDLEEAKKIQAGSII